MILIRFILLSFKIMKIAILYICTGNYDIFWKGFYNSSEKYFFPEDQKHYFVFTDSEKIKNTKNITVYPEKCKGFPLDSMLRFEMFYKIYDDVLDFDYTFFLNANMLFVDIVSREILPHKEYKGLICVLHPIAYKYRKFPAMYTYERNKNSKAYIPREKGKKYSYFMGGFNGGSTAEYFKMVANLKDNIKHDLSNGIVAVFHDESHLNKYCHNINVHELSPAYGFPENGNLPFVPKVIIRDKTKINSFFNKRKNETFLKKIKRILLRLYNFIIWR